MHRIYIFIFLFLSILSISKGQEITIKDKSDLSPVVNAVIYGTQERNLYILTDINGKADLSKFENKDSIFIRHTSYQFISGIKSDLLSKGNIIYLTDNIIKLNEVVVSSNKSSEIKAEVPHQIEIISRKDINNINPQTSGDLLAQQGSVFVQTSQMGGGSPVLRGFEANKVLMVVDGVRMNNAIYRSGHLQNIITIDPNVLENVEVLFGPGSVIYGSDALGGVMNFQTKNPILRDAFGINGNALLRYSSANNEKSVNLSLNYGFKKIAFFTAFTYKDLGDLRSGSVHNSDYPNFGYCGFYVDRINGKDSMIINSDSSVQKYTAYKQYDFLQKILYKPNNSLHFILNAQLSNSSNINRYDRLSEKTNGKPTYSEWYYGPQFRSLLSLSVIFDKANVAFEKGNIILAWQNIGEDRINRKFNSSTKTHQEETVNVISFNADFSKKIKTKDQIFYGIDLYYNDVQSQAYKEKITTGVITQDAASRYPDAGSTYITSAAYISNVYSINNKLKFNQGLRFSYIELNSAYSDTMMKITKFPFEKKISQKNSALNGNLGLTYLPGHDYRFVISLASGYRAPNVDDVSKVNDSKAGNKLLIIPNPDLESEYAYNLDLNISKTFLKKYQLEATFFYTLLEDAIAIRDAQLNGQDSVIFDGKMCKVQSNFNVGEAEIYGFNFSAKAQLTKQISLYSNLTYTHGWVLSDGQPLDHIPPVYGITGLRFETTKIKAELFSRYNAWKRLSDYSLSGEDNLQYATAGGMPSWYTLNFRASYQIHKYIGIQVGIENIMDVHYRYFASGVSAPGRNFVLALRSNF